MTPDLTVTAGDRLPVITRTITVDGVDFDLTGASVAFQVASPADPDTLLVNGAAVVNPQQNQGQHRGEVTYSWTAQDASTLVQGYYLARFVVTVSGKRLTVPNNGWLVLLVSGATIGQFTYSGDPSTNLRDRVRFLVNDTDPAEPYLSDAEVAFLLSNAENDVYQAAHDAAYQIAAQFTRKADSSKSVGDLSLSLTYGNRADAFFKLGDQILEIAARRQPPLAWASPGNTAQVTRQFAIGQMDFPSNQYPTNTVT